MQQQVSYSLISGCPPRSNNPVYKARYTYVICSIALYYIFDYFFSRAKSGYTDSMIILNTNWRRRQYVIRYAIRYWTWISNGDVAPSPKAVTYTHGRYRFSVFTTIYVCTIDYKYYIVLTTNWHNIVLVRGINYTPRHERYSVYNQWSVLITEFLTAV